MQGQKTVLTQQQKLGLNPQLIQAIKFMALPLADLRLRIQEELETNPVLEIAGEPSQVSLEAELGSEKTENDSLENVSDGGYSRRLDPEKTNAQHKIIEGVLTRPQSLREYLLWQLGLQTLTAGETKIGERLIWNLDSNGFHREDPDSLFPKKDLKKVHRICRLIQEMDPVGVCAADYREALAIQIRLDRLAPEGLLDNLDAYLQAADRGKEAELAKKTGQSRDLVKKNIDYLKTLTPLPGQNYNAEPTTYLMPDVIVKRLNGELVITLNEDGLPQLTINSEYRDIAVGDGSADKQTVGFIRKNLRDAKWFMQTLEQRHRTLFKVMNEIVRRQKLFFLNGPKDLAPLTLADIAGSIEMHESSVSRIANAKHAQTEWGVFPLRYFFSNSLENSRGGDKTVSRVGAKEMVREIIEKNRQSNRLTDQKISDILKEKGVSIARRTVAKYRREMDVQSSHYR